MPGTTRGLNIDKDMGVIYIRRSYTFGVFPILRPFPIKIISVRDSRRTSRTRRSHISYILEPVSYKHSSIHIPSSAFLRPDQILHYQFIIHLFYGQLFQWYDMIFKVKDPKKAVRTPVIFYYSPASIMETDKYSFRFP